MADDLHFEAQTLSAVRLTADLERHPALRSMLERMLGTKLPESGQSSGTNPMILWQGPKDWLILTEAAGMLVEQLTGVACSSPILATDAGGGLVVFELDGDNARHLLARGTALDLHPDHFCDGSVAVTRFAQVRVTIYRKAATYTLIAERPVAERVAAWLNRARQMPVIVTSDRP